MLYIYIYMPVNAAMLRDNHNWPKLFNYIHTSSSLFSSILQCNTKFNDTTVQNKVQGMLDRVLARL